MTTPSADTRSMWLAPTSTRIVGASAPAAEVRSSPVGGTVATPSTTTGLLVGAMTTGDMSCVNGSMGACVTRWRRPPTTWSTWPVTNKPLSVLVTFTTLRRPGTTGLVMFTTTSVRDSEDASPVAVDSSPLS